MAKRSLENNESTYIPTEDEYIQERINEQIADAVHVMNTRDKPRVYYANKKALNDEEWEKEHEQIMRNYYKSKRNADAWMSPDIAIQRAANYRDEDLRKLNRRYKRSIKEPEGATCIFTYTDSYGQQRAVPGNKTWLSKGKSGRPIYEEKGFKLLNPGSNLQKGDMIQLGISHDNPYHTVMFMDYTDNEDSQFPGTKEILSTYSNGGYDENAMRTGTGFWYNPNTSNAFRFVGNAADSAQWKADYQREVLNKKRFGGRKSLETIR